MAQHEIPITPKQAQLIRAFQRDLDNAQKGLNVAVSAIAAGTAYELRAASIAGVTDTTLTLAVPDIAPSESGVHEAAG